MPARVAVRLTPHFPRSGLARLAQLARLGRLAAALLLALGVAGAARADSPHRFFKQPSVLPDRLAMTEADMVGMTQQSIGHVGLRWISYESGGRWHTLNEKNRPVSGTWEIDDGRVCVKGGGWYPKPNCYTFYGSPGAPSGITSQKSPGMYFPTSLFRTADPADGAGQTMRATLAEGGAFPFPARVSKFFVDERALTGWRIEIAGGGPAWLEFHPGGKLVCGDRAGKSFRGKWRIGEYGEVILKVKQFWNGEDSYEFLDGTSMATIRGAHDAGLPFRYYPVRVRRIGG